MKRDLQPWEFEIEFEDENTNRPQRVFYPYYEVDTVKSGHCVKLVEKGGKRNPNGKVFYCDADGCWLRVKDGLTPMHRDEARSMIDNFRQQDKDVKYQWKRGFKK